jgi:hypothetical protein
MMIYVGGTQGGAFEGRRWLERYTWSGDPRRCNLVVNGRIEWLDRVRRRYTVRRHVCLVRFLCPEDRV